MLTCFGRKKHFATVAAYLVGIRCHTLSQSHFVSAGNATRLQVPTPMSNMVGHLLHCLLVGQFGVCGRGGECCTVVPVDPAC